MNKLAPIFLAALLPAVAGAGTFLFPSPAYVNATKLITFSEPDEAMLSSISDGFLTVAFSTPVRASTVGDDWATWNSPPATESSTPRVLWSDLDDNFNPVTTLTFSLSAPVSIFGFEAEPGPTDVHTLTANFYLSGQLQQTISRDVSGNAGALLFAATGAFDSVVLSSDADFAVGQIRYAAAAVPEPCSWVFAAASFLLLLWARRKLAE
jgi:hypothetical protein